MNITLHTPFSKIYDNFLSKITDDMYMELTELDTFRMLEELLMAAIPKFEFPRVNLNDFEIEAFADESVYQGVESDGIEVIAFIYDEGYFSPLLTLEEINILSTYMIVEWFGYQLASVENTRMKYSGTDFKFTSQANHMQKLLALKKDYEREGFHLQRLYKRRAPDENGIMRSTLDIIVEPIKKSKSDSKTQTTTSSTSSGTVDGNAILEQAKAYADEITTQALEYVNALTQQLEEEHQQIIEHCDENNQQVAEHCNENTKQVIEYCDDNAEKTLEYINSTLSWEKISLDDKDGDGDGN